MCDNRLFNINGRTKEQLSLAVKCLLLNEYGEQRKISGWYFDKSKGFVLTWWVGKDYKATPFTNRLGKSQDISESELVDVLWDWLKTDEAKSVEFSDWEGDIDQDGDNEEGWRLYTEDWGCIKEGTEDWSSIDHYSIAAFKRVYLWYGK